MITLGRFDVGTAVMTMSGFRVAPREGHMARLRGFVDTWFDSVRDASGSEWRSLTTRDSQIMIKIGQDRSTET